MATKKTADVIEDEVVLNQEDKPNGTDQESRTDAPETNTQGNAEVEVDDKPLAKAGKRSHKAVVEQAEKDAKEARKAAAKEHEAEDKPKVAVKPTRTRLERAGKKLRAASELIDKSREYSLVEAVELSVKTGTTKFDSTVELHINLNVDPRQADQNIRDNLVLPSGTGKTVRVAVLADGDQLAAAKKAGADIAGSDDFLQQLDKGVIDFDLLIATPTMMPKLSKYARVLGPKGLMPNPKSGTVTPNVAKAIEESKAGRVEYRVDSNGIVHLGIGKVSFGAQKLTANLQAVMASIKANKPASVKGNYITAIHLATTMGPSIKIGLSEA